MIGFAICCGLMTLPATVPTPRTWDGRFARWLVTPLRDTWVTPNQLTSLRLAIGVAGAACLAHGGYAWANAGTFLIALSNFVDHTDGELARISGKTSRIGHFYDLASDAVVTVLLFVCLGAGLAARGETMTVPPVALGLVAGVAVALIFFLRMRIESIGGKSASKQSFAAGFETEDVLYLLPLVTLFNAPAPFLVAAAIGAPLFALWVLIVHRRLVRSHPEPTRTPAG
jgi:phosphatidylglycerophosphate synthase